MTLQQQNFQVDTDNLYISLPKGTDRTLTLLGTTLLIVGEGYSFQVNNVSTYDVDGDTLHINSTEQKAEFNLSY